MDILLTKFLKIRDVLAEFTFSCSSLKQDALFVYRPSISPPFLSVFLPFTLNQRFSSRGSGRPQIRSRWILEMNDGRAGTRVATIHARVYRCIARTHARTQARGIVARVPPLNRCGVGEPKPEEKRSGSGRAARLLVYSGVQGGWGRQRRRREISYRSPPNCRIVARAMTLPVDINKHDICACPPPPFLAYPRFVQTVSPILFFLFS